MVGAQFKDHSKEIKQQMDSNILAALTAMGLVGVEVVTEKMNTGYARPIYQTGDLLRDVSSEPDEAKKLVRIGNSLAYAPWVHNGTMRMTARPYLKDGITENIDRIQKTCQAHIKKGFK